MTECPHPLCRPLLTRHRNVVWSALNMTLRTHKGNIVTKMMLEGPEYNLHLPILKLIFCTTHLIINKSGNMLFPCKTYFKLNGY